MRIVSIGGGPAGLYFAILMKKQDPSHEVTVLERNKVDDTFGFGVVFSDRTMDNYREADEASHAEITRRFTHWDDIDIFYKGTKITSTGHGFAGFSRKTLLEILANRARELGVDLQFETDVTDPDTLLDADLVLGADGVNSTVREKYKEHFQPEIDWRPNKFVWLGMTKPLPAFTFWFKYDEHGLWRVHAYQYEKGVSTLILECTHETWKKAGMDKVSEDETVAFTRNLFSEELEGHTVLKNRSLWRNFPTIRNRHWSWKNVVLMGDAVHTAHFSVGSGTKLAMEDAIALERAIRRDRNMETALAAYEKERRPECESLQRAAQTSLEWFEDTERYMDFEPTQFAYQLLTRSLRINHDDLRLRDPKIVQQVDEWFAKKSGVSPRPPMFTPYTLRDMKLETRVVVSPMCQYSAEDGTPDDWHLVHLGSRAVGGAGLVFTEMTNISREARISPGCAGIYKDEHVVAWKRIVDFVHANTFAKIGMQIGHAGRKGSTRLAWEGMDKPLPKDNWEILAPSPIPYTGDSQVPKEMDRTDMDKVRDDFVRAAKRADEAGFDIIEVHMAHGYLLATFLSPATNKRADEYGGSMEDRLRFPSEVLGAIRAVWPDGKPISVRISAHDWVDGGTTPADAVEIARGLKAAGADIIDVSAGQTVPTERPVYGRAFQTPFSDRIRHEAGIATMAVGNISSYGDVNALLASGRADLAVMARAHLWDPYWARHAAYELGYKLPWPDPYGALERFTPRFQ